MSRLFLFIVSVILIGLSGCVSIKDPYQKHVRNLQKGRVTEDTSFVYQLPYEEGKTYRMIQGYYSAFSHKNRAAIDFKMKRGTKICAARDGIVIRVKEDGDRGGWNRKYRPFGNNIVIEHSDGSRAGYWHLQKDGALVNIGDTVKAGQVIALSGKTGYTAVPHLHFMVWSSNTVQWRPIPTRFQTESGIGYLRSWKKHRKPVTKP
jgi:murein DD-endopeptidase MepM/ murein hydrolase activator NlpD